MWQYKYEKGKIESMFNLESAMIIGNYCKDLNVSLELGAGKGELSFLLMQKIEGLFSYLIDSSESAVKYIKEYYTDRSLKEGFDYNVSMDDVFKMAPRSVFDLVMSSGLIEHFQGIELKTLCQAHKKFSKKYIACIVPFANEKNCEFAKSDFCKKRYGYEKPMTEKELDDLFIDENIKKIHSQKFYKDDKLLIGLYEKAEAPLEVED